MKKINYFDIKVIFTLKLCVENRIKFGIILDIYYKLNFNKNLHLNDIYLNKNLYYQ
jgi:hypothetical protein